MTSFSLAVFAKLSPKIARAERELEQMAEFYERRSIDAWGEIGEPFQQSPRGSRTFITGSKTFSSASRGMWIIPYRRERRCTRTFSIRCRPTSLGCVPPCWTLSFTRR